MQAHIRRARYFIFLIRSKDWTQYTGPEQRIREMLDNKDVSWWPMNRALVAEGVDDSEDGVMNRAVEREVPVSNKV